MPKPLTQEQKDKNKAKRILKDIVEIFNTDVNHSSTVANNLWAVLSALRGPDNSDYSLKQETTAKIRGAIGIKDVNRIGIDVSKN